VEFQNVLAADAAKKTGIIVKKLGNER